MDASPPPTEDATPAAEVPHEDGLSIPRHLWSAPVSETRADAWTPRLPWFARAVAALTVVGLLAGFLSAQAATHRHPTAAGWLLGLAVCSVVTGVVAMAVHLVDDLRYDCGHVSGERR